MHKAGLLLAILACSPTISASQQDQVIAARQLSLLAKTLYPGMTVSPPDPKRPGMAMQSEALREAKTSNCITTFIADDMGKAVPYDVNWRTVKGFTTYKSDTYVLLEKSSVLFTPLGYDHRNTEHGIKFRNALVALHAACKP